MMTMQELATVLHHKIKYLYQGRTANPPKEILEQFGGHHEDVRSHDNNKIIKEFLGPFNAYFIRPWVNVNKKYIYEQYKKYNLLDTLEPLTWSCIAYAEKTNFFSYRRSCKLKQKDYGRCISTICML